MADPSLTGTDESGEGAGIFSSLPLILWERRWLILVPLVPMAIAGVAASLLIAPSYESRAVLLVESQDVPGQSDKQGPDDGIDRRMAKIREQILSRPDLVALIQAHNLYGAANGNQPLSALIDKMRDSTSIRAVDANIEQGTKAKPGSASIAFSLTFDYPRPDLAQLVAQTFVDRLLRLDATTSQAAAGNNVRFLEDQEATLQTQLTGIEGQINRITGQNGAALSGGGSMAGMSFGGGNYESQIATLQHENAQLRSQTGSVAIERDPGVVAAQSQLAAARAQFADDHPDVLAAQRAVAAARSAAAALQTNAVSGTVQAQIKANDAMIAQLNQARGSEQARAATMAAAQARGPAVAQQVAQLQAQADSVRTNMSKISSSLLDARSTQKLTEEQRGEHLTLIDPPVRPDSPTSPNSRLLIGGGIGLGGLLGVALALLVEFLMKPIRSVSALTRLVGEPPLAVVPVISKRKYRAKKKRWARKRQAA